jgi:hypothetical protein
MKDRQFAQGQSGSGKKVSLLSASFGFDLTIRRDQDEAMDRWKEVGSIACGQWRIPALHRVRAVIPSLPGHRLMR